MRTCLRAILLALATAALTAAAGCVSVDVNTDGGANMVVVENEGCYLLGFIPLITGDPDYPNRDVCVLFEDTQTLDTNMKLIEQEAAKQGAAGIRNISSHFFDDPIIYILLKRRVLQTSAELTR